MAVIRVNGIEIYYEVHGEEEGTGDGSWVLNIGGTGGDLRHTFPDRSPLNRAHRVLHYDQRGLGRTSKPDAVASMADYADDAAALITEVVGGPCHVVGTSFGGMVALNLVVRHPDLVSRLVLMCTSPGGTQPSYPLHTLDDLDPDERFATRMRLTDRRWDPDAEEPIPGLGVIYDFMAAQMSATPSPEVAAGLARQLAARAGHDVIADLADIEQRTLICAGRFDDLAPLANSELLAARIPNATLDVFEGGHLFMFQDRRAFPAILDFLG